MGPLKLEDTCFLFFAPLPDRLRRRSGHASHICVKPLPSRGSITLRACPRARVGSLHSLRFAPAQTRRAVKTDKPDTPPLPLLFAHFWEGSVTTQSFRPADHRIIPQFIA